MRLDLDDVRRARLRREPLVVLSAAALTGVFTAMRAPSLEPWLAPPRIPLLILAAGALLGSLAAWQSGRRARDRAWSATDDVAWVVALGVFGALAGTPVAPVGLGTVLHALALLTLAMRDPSPSLVVIASASTAMIPVLRALLHPATTTVVSALLVSAIVTAAFSALAAQSRRLAHLGAERDAWVAAHARLEAAASTPVTISRPRASAGLASPVTAGDGADGLERGWDALVERMRVALTNMAETAGVSADVKAELTGLAPPSSRMRSNLLRIAHEAMTQTLRVAAPRAVSVTLKRADGGVVFELTDDGSLGQEARQRRSLPPLRGRVASMGGTAEIMRVDDGWVTRVRLPAEQLN